MVSVILYFFVGIPHMIWFWYALIKKSRLFFLPIIFSFIGLIVLSFFIAVGLENEYFEFVEYLINGVVAVILFWIYTITLIIIKNNRNKSRRALFEDIAQTLFLPLVPALLYFWLNGYDFRIGG